MVLAWALSMDAFAVSVGLGSKHVIKTTSLSLLAGLYFGIFQGIMPFIGYVGGRGVFAWVEVAAPWVAFLLLLFIGGKMIYASFSPGIEDDIAHVTHKLMLTLAIATSIDAMAAGFSLTLLDVNPLVACITIGVTTFIFSTIGVFVGDKFGTWLENKAELLGGIVLVLIGLNIVLV